jgi:hypothetical protein
MKGQGHRSSRRLSGVRLFATLRARFFPPFHIAASRQSWRGRRAQIKCAAWCSGSASKPCCSPAPSAQLSHSCLRMRHGRRGQLASACGFGSVVFRWLGFSGKLRAPCLSRSSVRGPAQPSSNYAFKRTAGTVHRVSCRSVGPRPLNASLAVRGKFIAASASSQFLKSGGLRCALVVTRIRESHSWQARRKLGARNSRRGRSPRRLLRQVCSGGRWSRLTILSLAGSRLDEACSLGLGIGLVGFACRALACLAGAGYRAHVGLSPVRGSIVMACRNAQLTRRSSGPRGQSIVFPAVLSARGRLTRR